MPKPTILKLIDKPKKYPRILLRTSSEIIFTHSFKFTFYLIQYKYRNLTWHCKFIV